MERFSNYAVGHWKGIKETESCRSKACRLLSASCTWIPGAQTQLLNAACLPNCKLEVCKAHRLIQPSGSCSVCQVATSTLHALGLHWWPQQRGDSLGTPASWDVPQENVAPQHLLRHWGNYSCYPYLCGLLRRGEERGQELQQKHKQDLL